MQQPGRIFRNVGKGIILRICQFAGFLETPDTFSKVSRFLDAEEASGSNPLSPTRKNAILQQKRRMQEKGSDLLWSLCAATVQQRS